MSTLVKIASVTVGVGGAASIDFSSIPATYTDLKLVYSIRNSSYGGNAACIATFNADGNSAHYSYKSVFGTGSAVSNDAGTWYLAVIDPSTATASVFSSGELYIPNYLSANQKSVSGDAVSEDNATAVTTELVAGLWSGTAAINEITLTPFSGSFAQYSSATLYGIRNS